MLSLSILTEYIKGFREVKEKFTLKLIAAPGEAESVSPQSNAALLQSSTGVQECKSFGDVIIRIFPMQDLKKRDKIKSSLKCSLNDNSVNLQDNK